MGVSPDLGPGQASLTLAKCFQGEPPVLRKCWFLLLWVQVEINYLSWQGNWCVTSFSISDLRSKASALTATPCSCKELCQEGMPGVPRWHGHHSGPRSCGSLRHCQLLLTRAMGLDTVGVQRGGRHPGEEVGKWGRRTENAIPGCAFAQMLKSRSISTNCSKLGRN